MIHVTGVTFTKLGQIYYFLPNNLKLHKDINVIVETEQGLQFGTVVISDKKICKQKINYSLKSIIKIADEEDLAQYRQNQTDALIALKKCKELVKKQQLNMKIVDSYYNFDRTKLIFHFISDKRVDFRKLAKSLAAIYKVRIELRQIGIRDKAKKIGGCGQCGRELCCKSFKKDLNSVSINMAKNQNISLNPSKINGLCGRLLCCLQYENDDYIKMKNKLPKVGDIINSEYGKGKVISVNVLLGTYKITIENKGIFEIAK